MQAVTMATIARENSTDTAVRTLAFDIEGEQLTQIGIMYGWLTLWDMPPIAEKLVRGQTNDNKAITEMLTARGARPLPPPG